MSNKNEYKILIVDDEEDIIELLSYNLKKENYTIETATDGKEAVEKNSSFKPNIILLDVMMPKMDGIEACRIIKENSDNDPYVIFLTARSEEFTEIAAFDVGANDFINKPIKPRALLSRIKAILSRVNKEENNENYIKIRELTIDRTSYTVYKNDFQVSNLPKKEFEILFFLASNPNKVFSRDQILSKIWGDDVFVVSRTVDVHIRKLREKIGEDYISTIKGVGYKFLNE